MIRNERHDKNEKFERRLPRHAITKSDSSCCHFQKDKNHEDSLGIYFLGRKSYHARWRLHRPSENVLRVPFI